MGRVVNTNNPGKIRNQLMRTSAELLRHLSQKSEMDDEAKDMVARLMFCLRAIEADASALECQRPLKSKPCPHYGALPSPGFRGLPRGSADRPVPSGNSSRLVAPVRVKNSRAFFFPATHCSLGNSIIRHTAGKS